MTIKIVALLTCIFPSDKRLRFGFICSLWIPAFAGMTIKEQNDQNKSNVIPAEAGIQILLKFSGSLSECV